VKARVDDAAATAALRAMAERYDKEEADRKAVLAKICPQIGVDDKGNAVTRCP
jgi:hypothetical protein